MKFTIRARDIAITDVEPDPASERGYVGKIGRGCLDTARVVLVAAGYQVTSSLDDDGQEWVWFAPRRRS